MISMLSVIETKHSTSDTYIKKQSYVVIKYKYYINIIRINMKMIGYKLFMKPPPQPHKTHVMILHLFDIVYVLRYYIFFKLQQLTKNNTQKDVT